MISDLTTEAKSGDHLLIISKGGFSGIHGGFSPRYPPLPLSKQQTTELARMFHGLTTVWPYRVELLDLQGESEYCEAIA